MTWQQWCWAFHVQQNPGFVPDKDLRGWNVQLPSTVLREMLNITTAIQSHGHEPLPHNIKWHCITLPDAIHTVVPSPPLHHLFSITPSSLLHHWSSHLQRPFLEVEPSRYLFSANEICRYFLETSPRGNALLHPEMDNDWIGWEVTVLKVGQWAEPAPRHTGSMHADQFSRLYVVLS